MAKRIWKAAHVTLGLVLTVGLCLFAASAKGQSKPHKKLTASRSHSKTHKARHSRRRGRRQRGQRAPTAERISEIQKALTKDGSFTGNPNGKWDSSTIEAMKRFQEAHGLNPSGKIDARSLELLGLGSQTAGIAPPLPPVPPADTSSLLTPPPQTTRPQN